MEYGHLAQWRWPSRYGTVLVLKVRYGGTVGRSQVRVFTSLLYIKNSTLLDMNSFLSSILLAHSSKTPEQLTNIQT
jgi:hypothetical protein